MKLLAGALLFGFASLASAQNSIIVGGGATLPAFGYAGSTVNRLQGPLRADTTGDGSLLGEYAKTQSSPTNLRVSYCQTGSGGGKNILAGNQPTLFTVNAACAATPNPIGFGATSLGETLAQPHFVGSDSPLASTDLSNYAAGHTSGQPVQIPSVSGAVAIVFNKAATKAGSANIALTSLKLNETQVCQIFSGAVTDWSALPASAFQTLPTGYTVSGPFKITYRSDGSGTSFAFSNHLSKVCGNTLAPPNGTSGNGVAVNFKTDQAYTTAAASYFSSYATGGTSPNTWPIAANGNPGVIVAIQSSANDGAIGYAETANALSASPAVHFASISRRTTPTTFINPSTYGGTVLPVDVNFDEIITGVNTFGRPNLGASGLTTQCIGIVNPEDYAEPASGYPIVAVSYLLGNSAANGLDVNQVRGVLFSPYNSAVTSQVFDIGSGTGLSFLSINGATPAQIQTKINGCIN
ncbi:substrate-binding domain-containing protein [Pinirhizobacter soli]|uniref:substrate-binding domain-containing protein n=1 Tax=Pinirhizobacter soli TaxID=2786953 RepID=UPI002029D2DE|nr:substrate-binding domain-containing protein [Pinirhizobacter soli]